MRFFSFFFLCCFCLRFFSFFFKKKGSLHSGRSLKDDQKKPLLISILPVNVVEHLLKSAAMRSDVEGSYEELEKELLENLAMIDQQNRKAIGNLNSVADSAAWWDDSYQGWLCAVSEANPQKKRKAPEETEEATSDDVSPSKGKSEGKGKEKGKGKGGLATIAVTKDTLHESVQLQKGKERQELAPTATVDAVQPWLHPEAVEQLAARKFERQGQRPRPILW